MAVSKRDFVAIAAVIKEERENAVSAGRESCRITTSAIALGLAHHFQTENPRFDRATFLKACGLT